MNPSINSEQAQSLQRDIKDAMLHFINAAIIAISPRKSSEEIDFLSNRDLGDEDAHDLFES